MSSPLAGDGPLAREGGLERSKESSLALAKTRGHTAVSGAGQDEGKLFRKLNFIAQ